MTIDITQIDDILQFKTIIVLRYIYCYFIVQILFYNFVDDRIKRI